MHMYLLKHLPYHTFNTSTTKTVSLSFLLNCNFPTYISHMNKTKRVHLNLLTMLHRPKICICICWNICQCSPFASYKYAVHQNLCVLTFLHLALQCMVAHHTSSGSKRNQFFRNIFMQWWLAHFTPEPFSSAEMISCLAHSLTFTRYWNTSGLHSTVHTATIK